MTCHPSGGLLATGGADRKVLVWDVDGGYCTHYFKGHGGVVSCVMFHPDPEKQLVSTVLAFSFDCVLLVSILSTKSNQVLFDYA